MSPILSGLGGITVKGYGHFGPTRFAVSGAIEPIAVSTVPSGGLASITFGSIPQTYTHLQIRGIARTDVAGTSYGRQIMRFNDDSGTNYSFHGMSADGATVTVEGSSNQTVLNINGALFDGNTANVFQPCIIDILDYANTNKNKTVRSLFGYDDNSTGGIAFYSGVWRSTSAVTSITIYARSNLTPLFKQYSTFALYGIKGA